MGATTIVRWMSDAELCTGSLDDLAAARAAGGAVWVDVTAPDAAAFVPLQEAFGLHPLAVEDCLHEQQRVKLDLYPDTAFLVWAFAERADGSLMTTTELDIFVGKGFLLTSHHGPLALIDQIACEAGPALLRGADWTLHTILDRGVDALLPLIDGLSDSLDGIEDALLDNPGRDDLQRLYAIKRTLVRVYRIVGAERDALRGMARRQEFISQDAYLYFQDVSDHLARAVDTIDTYRDVASGAMDIYLSAVNNRLNDVMKRLTIVATVFMPLTLITGIFGMNLTVGMWPPTSASWSFATVMLSMAVIIVAMLWYFRRRDWL